MKEYCGEVFSKLERAGEELSGLLLEDCLFQSCRFTELSLVNCRFSGCRFVDCKVAAPKLRGCQMFSCDFENCALSGWIGPPCWTSARGRWAFCPSTA